MTSTGFVIAATGLAAEARIAARASEVRAIASYGDEARLATLIDRALSDGGAAIISFGIAGGLRPGLQPGNCIIGRTVTDGSKSFFANSAWSATLMRHLPSAVEGAICGVTEVIARPHQKAALRAATGADAADMESHVVARLASERSVPFAVLRVIADPPDRELPAAAVAGLKKDGTVDFAAVLRSIMRDPLQMPQLIRVAADTQKAMSSLLRSYRAVGPRLGFTDLG